MQCQIGRVGTPGERRQVVDDHKVNLGPAGSAGLCKSVNPIRCEPRRILFIEMPGIYAIGIALEGHRPPRKMCNRPAIDLERLLLTNGCHSDRV
jgi:hypothetical protein